MNECISEAAVLESYQMNGMKIINGKMVKLLISLRLNKKCKQKAV